MVTAEALERNAFKYPFKVAVKDSNRTLTYHELNERTSVLANSLMDRNITKGDKVAILFNNCVEFVEIYFAVQKIGGVAVPLNTRLVGAELDYIINNSDARVLFYDNEFRGTISSIRDHIQQVNFFVSPSGDQNQKSIRYETLFETHNVISPQIHIDEDDACALLYTSGTTGRPKGVIYSHMNTLWNTLGILIAEPFYPADITMIIPPLYHAAGLNSLLFTHLFIGGSSVLLNKFDPVQVLETIERERITNAFFVPTMFNAILNLDNLNRYSFSNFRLFINGAATLPVHQKRQILKIFKSAGLIDVYGLTEVSPIATVLNQRDSLTKTESVGKVLVTFQDRVIADDGSDLSQGEPGELLLKGPQVMKGYYRDSESTAKAIKDGWLSTGDIVRKDAEGFVYIVDRKKDMIITGGENVYPAEVEAVLYKHPKIYEAAVVGFPDGKWGERVKAFVVLKAGERVADTEIIEFCKKHLASYKKPTIIEFVDQLPRTASGKVMKSKLRGN